MLGIARRFGMAGAIAVVVTAAFLPGAGFGSRAAAIPTWHERIPGSLAHALNARFGASTVKVGAASDSRFPPNFGLRVSVSADGTTALVGAPGANGAQGAAYIYHATAAGSWTSMKAPTATLINSPKPQKQELFGYSVGLSSDGLTAVVGAPLFYKKEPQSLGAVFVFRVASEDAWASTSAPVAALTVNSSDPAFLGISLALSADGTTVVAGAPFSGDAYAGGAYIFHAATADTWASTSTPTATLSNATEDRADQGAGEHVAISGDGATVLLSDYLNPKAGGAFLYHAVSEATWASSTSPNAVLTDGANDPNEGLGYALALSNDGTAAFLGAPGAGSGNVSVFQVDLPASWASTSTPTAVLSNSSGWEGDAFGFTVAVSGDGTTAVVNAPGRNKLRGAADVFQAAPSQTSWTSTSTPTATLTNGAGLKFDELGFGLGVSQDGSTVVVGAPAVRYGTGAADVFHATEGNAWATTSTPAAILTNSALDSCVVPVLRGKTVSAAKALLKARSCRLGKVTRVDSKVKKGRIVSQSLKPFTRPKLGTKVAVKVSK